MRSLLTSRLALFVSIVFIATLFTASAQYHYGVISPDSTLYLYAAKNYQLNGLLGASKIYFWPFYPILITWISALLHISLLHSALLLNYLLLPLVAITFLLIIRELGGNIRCLWLAVFVFFSFHSLIKLYYDPIRDTSYYLFYLLSILFLLKFIRQFQFRYALLWMLCIACATLFRFEGLALLFLVPLSAFFLTGIKFKKKIGLFIKLNSLSMLVLLVAIILISASGSEVAKVNRLYLFIHEISAWHSTLIAPILTSIAAMKQYVINPQYSSYASVVFISGLLFSYAVILASLLGLANLILIIFDALKRPTYPSINQRTILFAYITANLLITLAYLLKFQFVAPRYLLAMTLTFLIFSVFGLQKLYTSWQNKAARTRLTAWLFPIVVLLLTWSFLAGVIHTGLSKQYLVQGAHWLNQRTTAEDNLFSSNERLPFYLNSPTFGCIVTSDLQHFAGAWLPCLNFKKIDPRLWQGMNYVLFDIKHPWQQKNVMAVMKELPIKVFHSNRYQRLLIFKLQPKPNDKNFYLERNKLHPRLN